MRTSKYILPSVGLLIMLEACSLRDVQPAPKSVSVQWQAPDFSLLQQAMLSCRVADFEDDAECADRRAELQQAVDAHSFCLNTKLYLYSCRAIERTVQRQYEPLTDATAVAGGGRQLS